MSDKLKGFEHLKKNIYDYIYEGMVKLGYDKNKSVSIFYEKGLIAWLLNTDINSIDLLIPEFIDYSKEYLGIISFEKGKDRYKITVPYEGVLKIAEAYKDHTFLKKLVSALQNKDCTLDDIENVFKEISPEYIKEEVDNSEFQYVFHFKDKTIDEFRYCFSFDCLGKYYHRLLDYDYENVVHETCILHNHHNRG